MVAVLNDGDVTSGVVRNEDGAFDLDLLVRHDLHEPVEIGRCDVDVLVDGHEDVGQCIRHLDTPSVILRRHRVQQAERRLVWGAAWEEKGLVFDRGNGGAIHPDSVSKGFGRLAKEAGLRPIRFHDLRHTSSLMLTSGTNPKVVSERLGHATVGFTLDRYSHLLPRLQEEAAERTGALIYGSG